jgi:hypothetical protein
MNKNLCYLLLAFLIFACSSKDANKEFAYETFRRSALNKLPQKGLITKSIQDKAEIVEPQLEECEQIMFFISDSLTIIKKVSNSKNIGKDILLDKNKYSLKSKKTLSKDSLSVSYKVFNSYEGKNIVIFNVYYNNSLYQWIISNKTDDIMLTNIMERDILSCFELIRIGDERLSQLLR